ncbi:MULTISPECIES: ArsR/SmtB family transcription factor [Kocuria]|uniref:Winged helix-turn-helix transcriptional regulator n=2 Tax=Kocuria TaxID=57493 RepID=A0A846THL3_9MICC|nr:MULTISPECIES: metalloregulator ArsR/SmtB family transcription factor [Kocuria]NKE08648.1 winged helix-turn-helix transcriptional regulator [Kocuria subflava]
MMSSEIFAVLADPTRRALLVALSTGERPVGDLVEEVGASQPTVSKHLRILREAALVEQRADGQRRLYRVNAAGLEPIRQWLQQFAALTAADQVNQTGSNPVQTRVVPRPSSAVSGQRGALSDQTGSVPREAEAGPSKVVLQPDGAPHTPSVPVLDPHVVLQSDEQPRSRGLLAQVLRRRRGRSG